MISWWPHPTAMQSLCKDFGHMPPSSFGGQDLWARPGHHTLFELTCVFWGCMGWWEYPCWGPVSNRFHTYTHPAGGPGCVESFITGKLGETHQVIKRKTFLFTESWGISSRDVVSRTWNRLNPLHRWICVLDPLYVRSLETGDSRAGKQLLLIEINNI